MYFFTSTLQMAAPNDTFEFIFFLQQIALLNCQFLTESRVGVCRIEDLPDHVMNTGNLKQLP